MSDHVHKFRLQLQQFDEKLLPPDSPEKTSVEFPLVVQKYLTDQFAKFSGTARIVVSRQMITVEWSPSGRQQQPLEAAVSKLEAGQYSAAILILELLASEDGDSGPVLYNLGMAYSDVGRLEDAVRCLERLVAVEPSMVNGWVALGVAFARLENDARAISVLRQALALEPDNLWANRNLGACLLRTGDAEGALVSFERATKAGPRDQQSFYGLAEAYRALGRAEDADGAYRATIKIDEYTDLAERAKEGLSSLAHDEFRRRGSGMERPDAVMYCLGALEKFAALPADKVQQITFEIAMLGTRGLDVNDSSKKYELRSLPGSFSGLHLVSIMYVGLKQLFPGRDAGFDLSKEFAVAEQMFRK